LSVWDPTNGEQQYLQRGPRHYITALAVSRDGRTVLSGGDDFVFRSWNLSRPGENQVLRAYDQLWYSITDSVACSPDGKLWATGNNEGVIWDAATGKERCRLASAVYVSGLVFSPDSKRLVGTAMRPGDRGGEQQRSVVVWDVGHGQEVQRFPQHGWSPGQALTFSADGNMLAGTVPHTFLKVWKVKDWAEIHSSSDSTMFSLAFHPEGQIVATGHGDGTIGLWDLIENKKKRTLRGPSRVSTLKFTPDGKTLISSGGDGTIRLWDAVSGQVREVIPLGPANQPLQFDLDASGKYLFAAGNSPVIFVLRLPEPPKISELPPMKP
jgi:WD40 repeat protein